MNSFVMLAIELCLWHQLSALIVSTDIFKFSTSIYSLTLYVYDAEDTTDVIFYVGQHQLMM